jgi:hypothetical protein
MGKKLDDNQIKELQVMFEESGAIEFWRNNILKYSQKARDILTATELNDTTKTSILGLIKKMEKLEH